MMLRVRLDAPTDDTIRSKAAEAGMSVSGYVRASCLRSTVRPPDFARLYTLNRICNALTDIARQARANTGVDLAVLQSLLEIERMMVVARDN